MNALRERLQYRVHRGHRKADRKSIVIALLAGGKGDGKAIARRRERAGRVRSVGARWIFKEIEIKHEFAGLIVAGADESGEGDGFTRGKGNPFGGDAIDGVRRVPMETVKAGDGGRMRILDAKSEARLPADHVDVESADGEMRGNFIVVRFGSQGLRFCGSPGDEEVRRESSQGRIQRDGFAFEVKDGEMCGSSGKMDFVVVGRADGIVATLEPFKANERKPAIRLQEVRDVLRAPCGEVFLPGSLLRG